MTKPGDLNIHPKLGNDMRCRFSRRFKGEWRLSSNDFSPIAISLGSYMDKAAGRRPCTGKKFTKDVSVLSR